MVVQWDCDIAQMPNSGSQNLNTNIKGRAMVQKIWPLHVGHVDLDVLYPLL